MTIDYLEELELDVSKGHTLYACPSYQGSEWIISDSLEDLKVKAQRSANVRKYAVAIYKLIDKVEVGEGDVFLVVRRLLDPGPRGEPHINWVMVDTKEAAEMLRDVSKGPTPYFGATIEEVFQPKSSVSVPMPN